MSGWNRSRARLARLILATLVMAGLGGCAQRTPTDQELRVSQRNEPGTLDPALANLPDELFVIRALSEGLVTPDPEGGEPVPAAASHWTVSSDGLTWTFHLRPHAKWSNGEPVTASDFIASWQRVLTPATGAPKASLLFDVAGAAAYYRSELADFSTVGFTAPDPLTLRITLARPNPQFLAYVASGPWIPVNPRTVAHHGGDWTRPGNHVGNGPFTLSEWSPNQHLLVARRPDFWDSAAIHIEAIRFLAFDNGDTEERAFRAGQVDVTMSVPGTKIAGYAAQESSPLRRVPLHETRFLAFNTTRPPLNDVRVRVALSLALDRVALATQVKKGGQMPAYQFVPPGLGGFLPGQQLAEDANAARRLLDEAGYPNGEGFPDLELAGWSETPVLEAVQAMWLKELGIRVRLGVRDAKVHLSALTTGDYDIGFMTAIPDVGDPANLLADLRSDSSANYSQWRNPAYDDALAEAAAEPTRAGRLLALARAADTITAECPLAPLYFNTKTILVSPRVHEWREDALWNRFYHGVSVSPAP